MSGGPLWTPDRDRLLIELARKGLPGSAIGEAMGISRSAVGGRIHRLNRGQPEHLWLRLISNVPPPGAPPPIPRKPRKPPKVLQKREKRMTPRKPPPLPPPPPPPKPGEPKLLIELEPDDCRWPVNDGAPFVFCAKPRADEGSYCQRHADLSRGSHVSREYRT